MPLFRQLELLFDDKTTAVSADGYAAAIVGHALRPPAKKTAAGTVALQLVCARDHAFEQKAAALLRANGAMRIAPEIQVKWNPRLKTCAGRADYRQKLISLNPLLHQHGAEEIERTFRHELAHFLAQFRAGRKRIPPHGGQWKEACQDLGIEDEKRCHTLPFPVSHRKPRFLYRCPNCCREFPRVKPIRRAVACLACCRTHSRGKFDKRFRLKIIRTHS